MKAIVLSGGGGKGAYQMGVWKALLKLNINYDIVTGTSIGALNALLLAQKDYYKGIYLWNNIDFNQIYENFNDSNIYKGYLNKILEGGIDTSKIFNIINKIYCPRKLYNSNIKYGIVSFNLSSRKPVFSTTKNTKKEDFPKYILASATCFPVFKPAKINEELYVDGGYYDNLPINLAIELGAKDIVAVDLNSIGLKRQVVENVKVTYINPNNKLESFLMFEKSKAKRMIKFGYNDTMKVFGKFEGNVYTFKRGILEKNSKRHNQYFMELCKFYFGNNKFNLNKVLENGLEFFAVDASKIYRNDLFNRLLLKKFDSYEIVDIKISELKEIKKMLDKKMIVKNIYIRISSGKDYEFLKIFKKEFLVAIYILSIRRNYEKNINWTKTNR